MKKIKHIILCAIIPLLFIQCNKPEIVIFKQNEITKMKTIKIEKINIRTLNYDPYLEKDLNDLLIFEMEKSGYKVIISDKNILTNQKKAETVNQDYDTYMNVTLIHRKYFQDIEEIENISLTFNFYTLQKEKICSVLFSETSEEHFINTKYLQDVISEMIKSIKNVD